MVATPLSNEIASFVKSKFEALVKKDGRKGGRREKGEIDVICFLIG